MKRREHSLRLNGTKWAIAGAGLALWSGACGGPEDPAAFDPSAVASPDQAALPSDVEARSSALTTPLKGLSATYPGPDYNRCVNNVAGLFSRLNARGDLQGFHYASAGYTPTSGTTWHAQSIVRLPYYGDSVLMGQLFVEDFDHPMGSSDDSESHLGLANLGFTGGNGGLPIGSNKTFNDGYNGSDWLVAPNPDDTFLPLWTATSGWTSKLKIDTVQNHSGGMQGFGWHVAVALQQWDGSSIPGGSKPLVKFFSFWDPQFPKMTAFTGKADDSAGTGNDATAITKLADGRYLLAMEKGNNIKQVQFWVSKTTNIDVAGAFGTDGRAADAVSPGYPEWTSMNLITECGTGNLFMLGFSKNGSADRLDLETVTLSQGGTTSAPTFAVTMTQLAGAAGAKNMFCSDNANQVACDFKASAGSYVDPNGHVVIYSTGYDADGCVYSPATGSLCTANTTKGAPYLVHGNAYPTNGAYSASTGYVRGIEFHERHGSADLTTPCPTLDNSWIEFYSNANYNSAAGDSGTYYHLDYNTWMEKPWYSLGPNDFNDKATSIRWCAPPGYSMAVYSAVNNGGSYQFLAGTGTVREIPDLNKKTYSYGGGSMNDSISSYWWDNWTDPKADTGVADPLN